jgi:hypothetical protein
MDATLIVIDSDAELGRARALVDSSLSSSSSMTIEAAAACGSTKALKGTGQKLKEGPDSDEGSCSRRFYSS